MNAEPGETVEGLWGLGGVLSPQGRGIWLDRMSRCKVEVISFGRSGGVGGRDQKEGNEK